MCFQGFCYFSCGHNRIFHAKCPAGAQDENPFMRLDLCPNYNSTSEKPPYPCGLAKFYCSVSQDGQFLDHAFSTKEAAQGMIGQIDNQLARIKDAAQKFTQEANARNIPQEARRQMPTYQRIDTFHRDLMQRRTGLQKTLIDASNILRQAQIHYERNAALKMQNPGQRILPPFVPSQDVHGKVPAELMPRPQEEMLAAVHPTPKSEDPRIGAEAQAQGSNTAATSAIQISSQSPQPAAMRPPPRRKRLIHEVESNDNADTEQKPRKPRGRPRRKQETPDDSPEPTDMIRRSTRVRGKQVNYAESAASSISSRDPSPEKSDAFSPTKSDRSVSPTKDGSPKKSARKMDAQDTPDLPRTSSSLGDMINDYKRRTTASERGTPLQRRQPLSGGQTPLHSSPASAKPLRSAASTPLPHVSSTPAMQHTPALSVDTEREIYTRLLASNNLRPGMISQHFQPAQGMRTPQSTMSHHSALMGLANAAAGVQNLSQMTPHSLPAQNVHQAQGYAQRQAAHVQMAQMRAAQVQAARVQAAQMQHMSQLQAGQMHPALMHAAQLRTAQMQAVQSRAAQMQHPQPMSSSASWVPYLSSAPASYGHSQLDSVATPSVVRRDSVIDHTEQHTVDNVGGANDHKMISSDYDRMRHSFSSSANITTPVPIDDTLANTDPKKRRISDSSPTRQNKRVRLSFPGDVVTDDEGHVATATSPHGGHDENTKPDAPKTLGEDVPTAVAPVLTPTSVYFTKAQRDQVEDQENVGEGGGKHTGAPAQDHEESDHFLHIPEIDWGVLNEGEAEL